MPTQEDYERAYAILTRPYDVRKHLSAGQIINEEQWAFDIWNNISSNDIECIPVAQQMLVEQNSLCRKIAIKCIFKVVVDSKYTASLALELACDRDFKVRRTLVDSLASTKLLSHDVRRALLYRIACSSHINNKRIPLRTRLYAWWKRIWDRKRGVGI